MVCSGQVGFTTTLDRIIEGGYRFYYYGPVSKVVYFRQDSILGSIYARLHSWPEVVKMKDERFDLLLPKSYAKTLLNEKRLWGLWYGSDFIGKKVLDVGSGAGETASYFFNHGASQVIGIEADTKTNRYADYNRQVNSWTAFFFNKYFEPSDLKFQHDFLKMDIEGGELALLDYEGELGWSRVELHPEAIGSKNCDKIVKRFSLKPMRHFQRIFYHD